MSILMASTFGSDGFSADLIVQISPTTANGIVSGSGTASTNSVTASSNNGVGPFTFAWAYLSGPNSDFTIQNPTSATTYFTNTVGLNETKYASYRVTLTDSLGNTGFQDLYVSVTDVSFEGPFGGIFP